MRGTVATDLGGNIMTNEEHHPLVQPTRFAHNLGTLAKSLLATVCGLLGAVLLVAGKSTAGAAFACSAVILVLPFTRLAKNPWLSTGLPVALVVVLCTIAIRSIANTDVVPEQATTGYVFVDQVAAIFRKFQEIVFGKN
jgi:hypothetical protein